MKFLVATLVLAAAAACAGPEFRSGPEQDRLAFVAHFQSRFPDIEFAEYRNGIYAIDEDARSQWLRIEAFPPYEFAVDEGQEHWGQPFPNGTAYADCFEQDTALIRTAYPQFDPSRGEVVTLALALNDCRARNGQALLSYDGEELISMTAYLAFAARGNRVQTGIPNADALSAYEDGKRFYYSKRGQLNFSCADCHVASVGQYVRADRLSASLGHPTHFPVYRSKLGKVISLHQRFFGCVRDVRAKPFELQSKEFRNLEYFLSYMSNGLELNGPGARK